MAAGSVHGGADGLVALGLFVQQFHRAHDFGLFREFGGDLFLPAPQEERMDPFAQPGGEGAAMVDAELQLGEAFFLILAQLRPQAGGRRHRREPEAALHVPPERLHVGQIRVVRGGRFEQATGRQLRDPPGGEADRAPAGGLPEQLEDLAEPEEVNDAEVRSVGGRHGVENVRASENQCAGLVVGT